MASKTLIQKYDRMLSVTNQDSELYHINQHQGQFVSISAELHSILQESILWWARSDGLFSPGLYEVSKAWGFTTEETRIPSKDELIDLLQYVRVQDIQIADKQVYVPIGTSLDFGAITKGYVADRIRGLADEYNITSGIVALGGDVFLIGTRPSGLDWKIAINDPVHDGVKMQLELHDTFVATSGVNARFFLGESGELFHHVLDPRTGRPVENDLASITVIAPSGVVAEALSTALFVMGQEDGVLFLENHEHEEWLAHVRVYWITHDGQLLNW